MTNLGNRTVKLQERDPESLIRWLEIHVDVEPLFLDSFGDFFLETLKYNSFHAITNKIQALSVDEFVFVAYKLLDTEKNRKYNVFLCHNEPFAYVIFEKKTGYILSNCAKLYLELVIEQGITKDEFDTHSEISAYYLQCLNAYNSAEY